MDARRRARVDRLTVDRSALRLLPAPPWSPEARTREERLAEYREAATVSEKIEAWRTFLRAAPAARRPSRDAQGRFGWRSVLTASIHPWRILSSTPHADTARLSLR
jgi:hypothetical protein